MSVTFNSNNKFVYNIDGQEKIVSRKVAKDLIIELAKTGNEQAKAIAKQIGRGPLAASRLRKGLADGTIHAEDVAKLIKEHLNDFKPRIGSKNEMKVNKSQIQKEWHTDNTLSKLKKAYDSSMQKLNDLAKCIQDDKDALYMKQGEGTYNACLEAIYKKCEAIQDAYVNATEQVQETASKSGRNFTKALKEPITNFRQIIKSPSEHTPFVEAALKTASERLAQMPSLLEDRRKNSSKLSEFSWDYSD